MLVFDFIFPHTLIIYLISIQHMDSIIINPLELQFSHLLSVNLYFLSIMMVETRNLMEIIIAFMVIEMAILEVVENLQNVIIVDEQVLQIVEIVIIINLMEKKVSSFLLIRFLTYFYPLIQ